MHEHNSRSCSLCSNIMGTSTHIIGRKYDICHVCWNDFLLQQRKEAESENEIQEPDEAYEVRMDTIRAEIEQSEIDEENRIE